MFTSAAVVIGALRDNSQWLKLPLSQQKGV